MIKLYSKQGIILILCIIVFSLPSMAEDAPEENSLLLNQKIHSLFSKKERLFRGDPDFYGEKNIPKCGTQLMRSARHYSENLWPENRFILNRPSDPYDYDYYGAGVDLFFYDTDHFRLHYTEEGYHQVPGSDQDPTTIPSYVVNFGSYFEEAWNWIINEWEYRPPTPDEGKGGNDSVDVYIMYINIFGLTTNDTDEYLYIIVRNSYDGLRDYGDPTLQEGLMKVTAVHEFFHIIQNEYDHWVEEYGGINNCWWEETTAVWLEDEVFDSVNDYLHYLGTPYDDTNHNGQWDADEPIYEINGELTTGTRETGWFDYPYRPIDYVNGYYEYGNAIWAKFLSENFGTNFIKRVFDYSSTQYDLYLQQQLSDNTTLKAIAAIEYCLNEDMTSLSEALSDFRLANLAKNYEEGDYYPPVAFEEQFINPNDNAPSMNYCIDSDSLPHGDLKHLTCHYLSIVSPEGSTSFNVTITPEDGEWDDLVVLIVGMESDYSFTYLNSLQDNGNSTQIWSHQLFCDIYPQILVIPLNTNFNSTKGYRISYSTGDAAFLAPTPKSPYYYQSLRAGGVSFTVINPDQTSDDALTYEFELYNDSDDLSSQHLVASASAIEEGEAETSWYVNDIPYNTNEIPWYHWRCRVKNGQSYSAWTSLVPFQLSLSSNEDEGKGEELFGCFLHVLYE
ncbi:MAG: MXAN_6640 family putative metalloprotease [bacterium]